MICGARIHGIVHCPTTYEPAAGSLASFRSRAKIQAIQLGNKTAMYLSLLRLYVEVAQQSPLLYIGLVVLLVASWALIVSTIGEILIRVFDIADHD